MSSWYRNCKGSTFPINETINVALTFVPNKTECEIRRLPYPPKVINKTVVYVSQSLKVPIDNVFSITHYVYESWKISVEHIQMLIMELRQFMESGMFNDPLSNTTARATKFVDVSNKPPYKAKHK